MRRVRVFLFLLLLGSHLLAPLAIAESSPRNIRFVTSAAFGYTNFEFNEKLDQTLTFPSTNLTAAVTMDRWQLSLNGGFSIKDADLSEEEDLGNASREDIDLTLGYRLNDNWALFAGYKTGETRISFTSRESLDEGNPISTREKYKQKGPYIGASYTYALEKAGRLNLSIAYADLRARNRFAANTDEPEPGEALEFDDLTGKVNGDTTGLSYALTWTMPLAGSWLFQTRFKINDYRQDVRFDGTTFKNVDETLSSLHVGLGYVF